MLKSIFFCIFAKRNFMPMRFFLHTLVLLLFTFNIQATEFAIETAQDLAKKYCQNPTLKKTGIKSSSSLRSASEDDPSYFIFSDDAAKTFCIVSANAEKILGYGDYYSDDLPPQLQAALDMYAASPQPLSELRSTTTRENIPPFMNVVFGTRSPYNKYIPDREGYGPPVGCVPVTLAQIAKYYEHPSKLMNDIPSYDHILSTTPDTIYHIEGQKAEGRTYNWNLILNHYDKDTTEDLNNEVAKLMWDCARSVETTFAQSGSAALTDMLFYSLIHYFGYNSDSLKLLSRASYFREEWLDIIHEELSKKRPIYMSGSSYNNGGHAFICDGYVDGYLHINWGWNGSSNGYFDVDILDYKRDKNKEQSNPDNGYSFYEKIIIGIVPGEGEKEYKRPQSASAIIKTKQEECNVDTKYRSTDNGFIMYTSFKAYKTNIDKTRYFALGYTNENGKLSFLGNGKSDYFFSNTLNFDIKSEFDSSYIGKDINLFVLESDSNKAEILIQDSIFRWWSPSELFDPITIRIPDTIVNSVNLIEPKDIKFLGEYVDSTIILNVQLTAERPEGSMRYFTLAILLDKDTLLSENNKNTCDFGDIIANIQRTFEYPDIMDKEMTLIALQTDSFTKKPKLKKEDWQIYDNFTPISFKMSDCKIFSKKAKVDTIVHSTKGTTQRFEITFSNPSPFEFYNDIYFLVENEGTGLMLSIPAWESTTKIIERKSPLFTRYINGLLRIYNHFECPAEMVFTKDTFSHVFYGFKGGDETTIALQILNGTNEDYNNTFILRCDSDTIASQPITVAPQTGVQINYSIPVIASDSDILFVNYTVYSIYDKDNNLLGKTLPADYYGRILQSFDNEEMIISIDVWPVIDSIMPPLLIGITPSLEDTSLYERLIYTPDSSAKAISLNFKLSDYCSIDKPKYIGLCKEDGTFYAYMELLWENDNSSPDILSNDISIIAVDGGIWISSDVDIPSLPIYNSKGSLIKSVGLRQNSSLFVPLTKGVYIIGNKKVLITS